MTTLLRALLGLGALSGSCAALGQYFFEQLPLAREGLLLNSCTPDGYYIIGSCQNGAAAREPFRWDEAAGAVFLGTLPNNPGYTQAQAVSDDGRFVAGEGQVSGPTHHLYRWEE